MSFIPPPSTHVQVSSDPGNQYSVSLMNSLVLYVGTQAIGFIHSKGNTPSTSTIAHTAHMDIFQHLVVDLDTEGTYVCTHVLVATVEPLYKDTPEMRTSPLIRTLHMVPATQRSV